MTIQSILDALKPEPLEGDHGAVTLKLREIASTMSTVLGPQVRVIMEPGARDTYSLVLYVQEPYQHREVLFRGRIPLTGFPVTVDFYDDERRSCSTTDELEQRIAGFLRQPDVRRRLLALRDLATQGQKVEEETPWVEAPREVLPRPVSREFIEGLRDAGANADLLHSLEKELEKELRRGT